MCSITKRPPRWILLYSQWSLPKVVSIELSEATEMFIMVSNMVPSSQMVHLSHPYMATGKKKNIALTIQTFVSKLMSLLFNSLSRFVIVFLPRSKHLLISWLQSSPAVILKPRKIKSVTASTFTPSICQEVMGLDVMISVFLMLSFKLEDKESWALKNWCFWLVVLEKTLQTPLDSILNLDDVKPRQHTKKQRHCLSNKCLSSQSYGFSSSHVQMWELDHKEDWVLKNWRTQTVVLEKTLESSLDSKEIKPVNSKGNQPRIFSRRTYWNWSSNTLATWCEELTHWKRPWCWERLKAKEEGSGRGWDSKKASLTQ